MTDVILIPWRGGQPDRERNLKFVLDWYEPLGLPVFLGDDGSEQFNRAGSRNAAAEAAGDWDVALIADADCIADLGVVREAFALARETGKLVLPHDDFFRFTKFGTKRLITSPGAYVEQRTWVRLCGYRWSRPMAPSGALVVARASFDAIGRYDTAFTGWGYEDTQFYRDAEATVGVTRLPGRLGHLWHPRDEGGPDPSAIIARHAEKRAAMV